MLEDQKVTLEIKCPKCHRNLVSFHGEDPNFCIWCGTRVSCEKCGQLRDLSVNGKFCQNCGAPLPPIKELLEKTEQ